MLTQYALLGQSVLQDVGADLVGDGLPLLRQVGSARISASRAARSSATQLISFEET
jgi:hypothetical protein